MLEPGYNLAILTSDDRFSVIQVTWNVTGQGRCLVISVLRWRCWQGVGTMPHVATLLARSESPSSTHTVLVCWEFGWWRAPAGAAVGLQGC